MQKVTPTPRTLTIRFKHHRSTILLEVEPLQSFSEIRAELLHALQETNPSDELNGQDVPRNADHIILGKAVDRNNLSLGYVSLDKESVAVDARGKGKGKGIAGSSVAPKAGTNILTDCPQGAGLRNGDVVAFKFESEVHSSDGTGDGLTEKWDVIVPTMEETYGDDDDADEGLGSEEG